MSSIRHGEIISPGQHLQRRKEIYEKLYPESKQYSSEKMSSIRHGGIMPSGQPASFTESTAKK